MLYLRQALLISKYIKYCCRVCASLKSEQGEGHVVSEWSFHIYKNNNRGSPVVALNGSDEAPIHIVRFLRTAVEVTTICAYVCSMCVLSLSNGGSRDADGRITPFSCNHPHYACMLGWWFILWRGHPVATACRSDYKWNDKPVRALTFHHIQYHTLVLFIVYFVYQVFYGVLVRYDRSRTRTQLSKIRNRHGMDGRKKNVAMPWWKLRTARKRRVERSR